MHCPSYQALQDLYIIICSHQIRFYCVASQHNCFIFLLLNLLPSQCIPTPLAWYAHQLPEWLLKIGVVGTYWVESVAPLLFFLPVRSLRILAFLSQILLQVLIIITGNYNFFNLLTITLSMSLADDWFFGRSKKCLSFVSALIK